MYGKGILMLLASILDRRLAAWYLLCFAVIFLLNQQPCLKAIGNVVEMTPLQLENQLLDGVSTKCWLIEFRAVWSPRCIQSSRVFAELSLRYSTEDLNFGSVDLGRFPKAGEKYNISLGVNMGQLPTYVLFQGSSEVSRLPSTNLDGNLMAELFSKSTISQYFELDRRLICHIGKNCPKR